MDTLNNVIFANFTTGESKDSKGLSLSNPVFHLANARHAGFMGTWEGKSNPFSKGSKLWEAWNLGRKAAATGISTY